MGLWRMPGLRGNRRVFFHEAILFQFQFSPRIAMRTFLFAMSDKLDMTHCPSNRKCCAKVPSVPHFQAQLGIPWSPLPPRFTVAHQCSSSLSQGGGHKPQPKPQHRGNSQRGAKIIIKQKKQGTANRSKRTKRKKRE